MDWEAVSVNAAQYTGHDDIDSLARRISAIHPDVGAFATIALAEIQGLHEQLAFSQRASVRQEVAAAAAGAHVDRQAALLRQQAEQLATAYARLAEIAALCDLADWSSDAAGVHAPATVLVDDLRSVLRKIPRPAISQQLRDE
jgi:hypothetical protein